MTVSTTVSNVSYSANDDQTIFPYPFKIFADGDLLVILRNSTTGVETTQTLDSDYTVTNAGVETGGNVVFAVAPSSGNVVFIRRNIPATQLTDYVENDPFPAESHEDALDKLTMLVQQNTFDENRAILFPETEENAGLNNILPISSLRADKLFGFDSSGNVSFPSTTVTQLEAAVSSFVNATGNNATSILYDPESGTAQQRTVEDKLREVVSIKDFGAVGDGVTDDTAEVQAALDYATANSKTILVDGNFAVYSTVTTSTGNVMMYGTGAEVSKFTLYSGAGINFQQSVSFGFIRNIGFTDSEAFNVTSPHHTTPLLLVRRGFGFQIEGCTFNGKDNRRFGLKCGDNAAFWASRFVGNRFSYCDIGVQIGSTFDQTHDVFINNTVDHNKICGAVICGLEAGIVMSNSFEINEGKTGLAILSGAFGAAPISRNFVVQNNYAISNCGNVSGNIEASTFKIGETVPDTDFTTPGTDDFTSTQACQQFHVKYNFLGGTDQYYSMIVKGFRHFVIEGNITGRNAASSHDINLTGTNSNAIISGNFNQNAGNNSPVLNSGSGTFKTLFRLSDGEASLADDKSLTFESTGKLSSGALTLGDRSDDVAFGNKGVYKLIGFGGSANTYETIFDMAADELINAGIVEVLITLHQSNGNSGSVHRITLTGDLPGSAGDSYQITRDFDAPSAPVQATAFQFSGTEFQVQRNQNFTGTALIMGLNQPFSF